MPAAHTCYFEVRLSVHAPARRRPTPCTRARRAPAACTAGQATPNQDALSPEPVAHLSQNVLLPLLLARARGERVDGGAPSGGAPGGWEGAPPLGEVLWGCTVTGVLPAPPPSPHEATAAAGSSSAGRLLVTAACEGGGAETLSCDYLVAADGANSRVRRAPFFCEALFAACLAPARL